MSSWSCSGFSLINFVVSFVTQKISLWKQELTIVSDVSVSQPHVAYAAFVHGVISKWNYLSVEVAHLEDFLQYTTANCVILLLLFYQRSVIM